jgi:ATP-dependent DNA helicase RecQ
MHPIEVLERYWNHTDFRPLQEDIINAVLEGEDTFVLLPTGGGKSVCFQIPALIKDGICIVVSPLIALMTDQVNRLKQKGIKAIALTSGLSYADLDTQLDNCIYGNYKFLYISPERLQQPLVQERIQRMNVNLIAVDEAHCISQWGNDFRPAYKNIVTLRELQPNVNCIALTATAKPKVVEDIIENLDFINPKIFKASFARPNIGYHVINTDDKWFELYRILQKHKGASIVYVRNRRATTDLKKFLEQKGISATFYHGGIAKKEKEERLKNWSLGHVQVMVATTAFGMGIDKADVRTVVHFNLPESLESYYQEAGRAGRDQNEAYAYLLKQKLDESRLKAQFVSTLPDLKFIKFTYNKLCNFLQISYGEGENTTHQLDFKYFCKTYNLNPSLAYNSLLVLDRNAIISLVQRFNYRTKVQFTASNRQVFSYLEKHLELNTIVKVLLRTYGGIFDYETKINLDLVANKANFTEKDVIQQLKRLEKDQIISLELSNSDSEITFLKPREDDRTINPIAKLVEQQNNIKKEQIEAVIAYTQNNNVCRSIQLLNYFGETSKQNCGICSVCISKQNPNEDSTITEKVLEALQQGELSSRQMLLKLNCRQEDLLNILTQLIELKKIEITDSNTYRLV